VDVLVDVLGLAEAELDPSSAAGALDEAAFDADGVL
jgi:hypothetical protein